jgi:ribosomal protein L37AE/L43A
MRRNNNYNDDPSGQSEIEHGFGVYGRREHERYWNNKPRVQILTPRSYEEELQKPKLCSQCSKPISFITQSNRWICYTCQLTWVKDFDTPLSSIENTIKPLQSTDPYEREAPAFLSAKRNNRLQGEKNYSDIQDIQISGNGRVVKIKTTNLAAAS